MPDQTEKPPFWGISEAELLSSLATAADGLTSKEADARLALHGENTVSERQRFPAVKLLLGQFNSPIMIILLVASLLSFFARDTSDSLIILSIILVSSLLGFWQEKRASDAVQRLQDLLTVRARAIRDKAEREVPVTQLVVGDVIVIAGGDIIPADARLLSGKHLQVDESALTGESFPVEKNIGVVSTDAELQERSNSVFMGAHVVSGSAHAVIAATGRNTIIGGLAHRIKARHAETGFEHGIRRFGYLLSEFSFFFTIGIFALNVAMGRPVLDSILFAVALAIGLTPQLLPAIIGVNLAKGAQRMAKRKVIVKRLSSIENFGGMTLLCTDKTGTLTQGTVKLFAALDEQGNEDDGVKQMACLNAHFQTGYTNPLDEALRTECGGEEAKYRKTGEIPFDFTRKRLSVAIEGEGERWLITKGALASVLEVCGLGERSSGARREGIIKRFDELGAQGFRVLGLGRRSLHKDENVDADSETGLQFLGFLVFADPPKEQVVETLGRMNRLGVAVKMITGDNRGVAAHIAARVGFARPQPVPGSDLQHLSGSSLQAVVRTSDVFAEIEPALKERILLAARKNGEIVGFLGDGVNDAPALHAADVGISVDSASDIAREAADMVLMEKNLAVLTDGIEEGRRTFANTMKYIYMAPSANFGNMFSMVGASLFLPFLPLLPKQILLVNLFTDLPEMAIATDHVDESWTSQPRRWNIVSLRKFMIVFGILSSVFDYLTFGILLLVLKADEATFRTGWFFESVVSAATIVLFLRTMGSFNKSRPSKPLFLATCASIFGAFLLCYTPAAGLFGFTPLPWVFVPVLILIVAIYAASTELVKRWFFRRFTI